MALKLKITKEQYEALDEGVKVLYNEAGDGYALDVDDIPDTGALKRAKDREAQQRKEAETRLKELEQQLEEIQGNDARKRGDIETLEKSWASKLEQRETELSQQIEALKKHTTMMLVDNVASEIAHKISSAPKLLIPHIKARLQADLENGEPKTRVLDAQGQPSALSVEDLSKEFSANPDFASVIIGSKASGGGDNNRSNTPKFTDEGKPVDLTKVSPKELAERIAASKE